MVGAQAEVVSPLKGHRQLQFINCRSCQSPRLDNIPDTFSVPETDPRYTQPALGNAFIDGRVEGHTESLRHPSSNLDQVLDRIEVEMEMKAEALSERRRKRRRFGGAANQGERRQLQSDEAVSASRTDQGRADVGLPWCGERTVQSADALPVLW